MTAPADHEPLAPPVDLREHHERGLMHVAGEVLELLRACRARWSHYTVWALGQPAAIVIRLTDAGDLPQWLDAQRVPTRHVSDGTDTRIHAALRGGDVLITWPATAPAADKQGRTDPCPT